MQSQLSVHVFIQYDAILTGNQSNLTLHAENGVEGEVIVVMCASIIGRHGRVAQTTFNLRRFQLLGMLRPEIEVALSVTDLFAWI